MYQIGPYDRFPDGTVYRIPVTRYLICSTREIVPSGMSSTSVFKTGWADAMNGRGKEISLEMVPGGYVVLHVIQYGGCRCCWDRPLLAATGASGTPVRPSLRPFDQKCCQHYWRPAILGVLTSNERPRTCPDTNSKLLVPEQRVSRCERVQVHVGLRITSC